MSNSAIQSDVQDNTPAATTTATNSSTEVQKSERELAFEAIEARHHGELAKENGYELANDATPTPAPKPAATTSTDSEDQLAQQLAETPAPAATTTTAPSNPATVKVKVDGEEAEVPFDQVLAQYQKNASADKRLAEATRLLREAQEREAQMLLQVQETQRQQAAQAEAAAAAREQEQQQQTASSSVTETGKEFLKALFEGDEENALAALEKVIAGRQAVAPTAPQQPTLDLNQITNAVTQQVQARVAITSVLEANRRDYPEMYADPDIEELAAQKIARLRNEQGVDFATALNTVSQDFAQKFGWDAARTSQGRPEPAAPPTVSTRTAKIAQQKQGIDNVTSITTKTLTPDTQPEDASSIIAQMRAQRGGG